MTIELPDRYRVRQPFPRHETRMRAVRTSVPLLDRAARPRAVACAPGEAGQHPAQHRRRGAGAEGEAAPQVVRQRPCRDGQGEPCRARPQRRHPAPPRNTAACRPDMPASHRQPAPAPARGARPQAASRTARAVQACPRRPGRRRAPPRRPPQGAGVVSFCSLEGVRGEGGGVLEVSANAVNQLQRW